MIEIPLARPNITRTEMDAVASVLRTPHLSLGPKLREFEAAFASRCGTRYAAACSSGTAGLHLVLEAIGVGSGDEVITSPFSFIASANCVLMTGAKPVFVDVDPATWDLNTELIEAAITPRTCAVLPVDVFGQIADMEPVVAIARSHGLRVVEDSCEALGTRFRGKMAGTFGDAGVFGFYPNKQITTGEGGMIVTDNEEIARLCHSKRNQGRDGGAGWLAHPRMGYNYRLSDINCALGLAQLGRLDDIMAERDRVQRSYRERLEDESRVRLQRIRHGMEMSWFVFVIRLSDEYTRKDRDRVLEKMRERGIGCSNYFAPIHLQPFFVERFGYRTGDFPVCEGLTDRTIALPFHHELDEPKVDRVCRELRSLL